MLPIWGCSLIPDESRRDPAANVVPLRTVSSKRASMSDEAIALACAHGDAAAIAELFDRHERTVSRFVYRMIAADDEVQDIVQATFVQVLQGISTFDGRSMVSTWLLGIAANLVRHHLRSKVRRRRFEQCLSVIVGSRGESAVTELVHARRTLALAHLALQKLDADKQIAFVMCEIEGLTAKDAALALGVTETVIWKRVSDARKALRQSLPKEVAQ